jgi:hypothetical protein
MVEMRGKIPSSIKMQLQSSAAYMLMTNAGLSATLKIVKRKSLRSIKYSSEGGTNPTLL